MNKNVLAAICACLLAGVCMAEPDGPYRVKYDVVDGEVVRTTNTLVTAKSLVLTTKDNSAVLETVEEYLTRNKPKMIMKLADGTTWLMNSGEFVAIKPEDTGIIVGLDE